MTEDVRNPAGTARPTAKGAARTAAELATTAAGLWLAVSSWMLLRGEQAKGGLLSAPVLAVAELLGAWTTLALGVALAVAGAAAFLAPARSALAAHVLGAASGAAGLALLLGSLRASAPELGGSLGGVLPEILPGLAGRGLGAGLGLAVLFAAGWLGLGGAARTRSGAPAAHFSPKPGRNQAASAVERETDDGVSAAEAEALLAGGRGARGARGALPPRGPVARPGVPPGAAAPAGVVVRPLGPPVHERTHDQEGPGAPPALRGGHAAPGRAAVEPPGEDLAARRPRPAAGAAGGAGRRTRQDAGEAGAAERAPLTRARALPPGVQPLDSPVPAAPPVPEPEERAFDPEPGLARPLAAEASLLEATDAAEPPVRPVWETAAWEQASLFGEDALPPDEGQAFEEGDGELLAADADEDADATPELSFDESELSEEVRAALSAFDVVEEAELEDEEEGDDEALEEEADEDELAAEADDDPDEDETAAAADDDEDELADDDETDEDELAARAGEDAEEDSEEGADEAADAPEEPAEAPARAAARAGKAAPAAAEAPARVAEPEPEAELAPAAAAAEEEDDEAAEEAEEAIVEVAPAAPRKRRAARAAKRATAKAPAPSAQDPARLVREAGDLILRENRVAVSMLQRRFGLDFAGATRVLDELQEAGLIGPYLGGRSREILLSREEWAERAPSA